MDNQFGVGGRDVPFAAPVKAVPRRNPPLTMRERLIAVAIGFSCVAAAGLASFPVALRTGSGVVDVLWSAFVYGGLLGSAVVVVYLDRAYARQCPRCGDRYGRDEARCARCGYDVVDQPRYTCSEAHEVYLGPGRCDCGLWLQRLTPPDSLARQLGGVLKLGGWMLALLLVVGLLLRLASA